MVHHLKVLAVLVGLAFMLSERSQSQTRLTILRQPAGWADLLVEGVTGTTNRLEWTDTLSAGASWTALTNLVLPSVDPLVLAHLSSTHPPRRFFRVVMTGLPVSNPNPAELVWIPPGTFTLGSPANEPDRSPNEGPQTQVWISRGFFMGKYEVTQEQFARVMGRNPSLYQHNPYAPVDSVTWADATNYCGRLTVQEQAAGRLPAGYVYRLPTEAEWEYAARAGTTNRFSFGDDPGYTALSQYAWYGESFGLPSHAVGQKKRHRWGLHDIHGNVFEWCLDWYGPYPGGSVTNPIGPATTRPGLRGGSAWSTAAECRCAARLRAYGAGESYANAGFRVVLAHPLP